MIILACDPGSAESGFVWVDSDTLKILARGYYKNEEVITAIKESGWWSKPYEPDVLVVEYIRSSRGMPVGEDTFSTVFWSGRLCQMADRHGIPWELLSRDIIKMHICGSMRAKDSNVRAALIDKLGPQGRKKAPGPTYGISGHTWQALAVAVTWAETRNQKV